MNIDNTLNPDETIEIINAFNLLYNKTYNTTGSMFELIDENDKTSTNDKMETFYEYMNTHKILYQENKSACDVFEYTDNINIDNEHKHDTYILVDSMNKYIYISLSYIGLLTAYVRNYKRFGKNWKIIKI